MSKARLKNLLKEPGVETFTLRKKVEARRLHPGAVCENGATLEDGALFSKGDLFKHIGPLSGGKQLHL